MNSVKATQIQSKSSWLKNKQTLRFREHSKFSFKYTGLLKHILHASYSDESSIGNEMFKRNESNDGYPKRRKFQQKRDILRDDHPEQQPQKKDPIPKGTDVNVSGQKVWYNPLQRGQSSSLPQKDYHPVPNKSFQDDIDNPINRLIQPGKEATEEDSPVQMQEQKEMILVDQAFLNYFNLENAPPVMEDEEIEALICHLGLEGVPRSVPIPYHTMATMFHDEDLDEAQQVIGNHKRRYLTTEELLGPEHFAYPIESYYDEDFKQKMVAILGPSEKMLNFGRYLKVRAEKAEMAKEVPPVGLDVWQREEGDGNPRNLLPIDAFKEGEIVEGVVMQMHSYAGVTVDFGCFVQGIIPVQHPSWSDATFDWINGQNPLKTRFKIGMPIICRIYRIWEPDVIWRFPIQLECLDPILKDFVTKPEQWVNPIQWGVFNEDLTRQIVEDAYGFPMETPSERYPEDRKMILTFKEWEPEWAKQAKFELGEFGFLWGAPEWLPEYEKKPEQMEGEELQHAADEELRQRAEHELNRPLRKNVDAEAVHSRKVRENLDRQYMQMKQNDFRSKFR